MEEEEEEEEEEDHTWINKRCVHKT